MKHLIVLFISVGFFACSNQKQEAAAKRPVRKNQYKLAVVQQGAVASGITLPGQLQPYQVVQLYPKVNGFVKEVLVDRGSIVRQGQVLMRLEAPEVEQQYLAARSKYLQQLALSQASKDRFDRLMSVSRIPGTVSAHDLAAARATMIADSSLAEGERSAYKALAATIDYLVMRAPFSGIITERNVHPGALVGSGQKADDKPLLVLQQEEHLRLVVDIPEEYTGQINNRQPVQFTINAIPGRRFEGVIDRESGALSNAYRTETVEVDVNNSAHQLKPGMYAEVHLPVQGNKTAMIVPRSAIVTSTEKKYVVVANGRKAKWVDIVEGNSHNDSAEVFGALHAGDHVVLQATDELKQGTEVD